MPYGESIPGESWIPSLRKLFGDIRILSPGVKARPIGRVKNCQLGVVLCCEDMVSSLARSLKNQGADILVSLGNGSAFKSDIALRQHFRLARGRAIESRTYFVRCASRGISALVAPDGSILEQLPVLEDCAAMVRVPIFKPLPTCYMRFGELPIVAICLTLSACAYRKSRSA